mmetsp:Transcript_106769/g.340910  ORF Transcript_106769/g.340910 Transcript_106769/m.340910 type:complete len:212 (+) Transcript_106769:481-1116(+)
MSTPGTSLRRRSRASWVEVPAGCHWQPGLHLGQAYLQAMVNGPGFAATAVERGTKLRDGGLERSRRRRAATLDLRRLLLLDRHRGWRFLLRASSGRRIEACHKMVSDDFGFVLSAALRLTRVMCDRGRCRACRSVTTGAAEIGIGIGLHWSARVYLAWEEAWVKGQSSPSHEATSRVCVCVCVCVFVCVCGGVSARVRLRVGSNSACADMP